MIKNDEYENDLEDGTEELDQDAAEAVDFWEKKQREVLISVVDYNLATLAQLVQSKTIDLSPKYQRRARWDMTRQSRLIESFMMNVPVPPIFLNEDEYGQYSVIDGKQRLTAITNFMRGRLTLCGLTVFSDINGRTFDDLPESLRNHISTRTNIRTIIILRQSDTDVKFEVFQRLNTGGVRLNPQEIRNSTYPGPLNDLILDLSVQPPFHELLGIANREKSAVYKEMRDAEFVLRYFTFRDTWQTFSGGMKRQMDNFMVKNQRLPDVRLAEMREDFLSTLKAVKAAFGEHAFRRWVPDSQSWRRQVLAALFDAEMFACRGLDCEVLVQNQAAILDGLKALFGDSQFLKAIDAATNTPGLFRHRIEAMRKMMARVIGQKGMFE